VVCAGSCAVDGGWQAAYPNPGGAIGIQRFLEQEHAQGRFHYEAGDTDLPPIINVPSCPANPEHLVAVLVDAILVQKLPELNNLNMPSLIFSQTIHDNCPRRGHFENGEFVYKFGSEEEKKGYCLYPVGCKGPQTKSNCPIVRWNRRASWCVESGAPCAGCAMADPRSSDLNWVNMNTPFLGRFRNLAFGDISIDPTFIAYGLGAVVVVALAVHGFGMKITGRTKGGAPFELERKWDAKHPDRAIGSVAAAKAAAKSAGTTTVDNVEKNADAAAASDAASDAASAGATNAAAASDATANDAKKGGDE
jgi:hydrogenase small subunit